MPKVNVYLPEDLTTRVKEAALPVSAICQAALGAALDTDDRDLTLAHKLIERGMAVPLPLSRNLAITLDRSFGSAAARGSLVVTPEDILQAIMNDGTSIFAEITERLGPASPALQSVLQEMVPLDAGSPAPEDSVTVAPVTLTLLAESAASVIRAGQQTMTTSYIALTLLDHPEWPAGRALHRLGLAEIITPAVVEIIRIAERFGRTGEPPGLTRIARSLRDIGSRLDRIDQRLEKLTAGTVA